MSLNQEEREAVVTYRLEKARKTMEQAKCNLPMQFWDWWRIVCIMQPITPFLHC